jgi:amino acid adenylation domain-containing protein
VPERHADPAASTHLLHERFDRRARLSPDRLALRERDLEATYGELSARSDRIARGLRARGIGRGGRVGLHVHRSIDWVAALLGILKSGAAVVPLHPDDPAPRLREILACGALDAVLDRAADRFPDAPGTPVLRLEQLEQPADDEGAIPAPGGDPEEPAFVLSSSGSTGRPKMIVRSHRSFWHRLGWTWARHPFGPDDVGCQKAHPSTTHSVYELFEPLLAGATTVLVPDADVRDLERFWRTVRERGVTRLLIVPSALRASLDLPGFAPPPLAVVVLMGEPLPRGLAERARNAFGAGTHLYSIYGSTEASSTLVCDLRADKGAEPSLGTPITPEVRALVLGDDLRPVGQGGAGRLFLSGPPLFTEYLGDRSATDAVLVRVPGEAGPVYDTRDQVALRADGALEFIGRVDHLVKVRGFRVDLAEVERVMEAHPGLTQAAVVARNGDEGTRLEGFFAPADLDPAALYRTLRERLPQYMVPSALIGVDRFPLTASGKVDRMRLADPALTHAAPPDARALSPTERMVAACWERTLGHRLFAPDSSFFEVGGTSLSVFTLLRRLREASAGRGPRLSVETLYRFPTVAGLAALLDRPTDGDATGTHDAAAPLVTLRGGSDVLPPLFVVASAGGTLGAYEKLAAALTTPRAIVGIRDPFVLGERDLGEGFGGWVDRYVAALRARQPRGPYSICAYSSAGAFGYEMARRLRAQGEEVALLALIDPQALDRHGRTRFGYWALRSVWMRPSFRSLVRRAGVLRTPAVRLLGALRHERITPGHVLADSELGAARDALRDAGHISNVAALMELNTGLPFALRDEDVQGVPPERALDVLAARVAELAPDVDRAMIERIVAQYRLQVLTQHAYRLERYDGRTLLVEPASPYAGILAALLRPYVRDLHARVVDLGPASERVRALTARFGGLATHYRCMRDDGFVGGLAAELDAFLA